MKFEINFFKLHGGQVDNFWLLFRYLFRLLLLEDPNPEGQTNDIGSVSNLEPDGSVFKSSSGSGSVFDIGTDPDPASEI